MYQFLERRLLNVLKSVFITAGKNGGIWEERTQDLDQLPCRVMKNLIFSHGFFLNLFNDLDLITSQVLRSCQGHFTAGV